MEKLTYTVSEMATALGISKATAYKLANASGFPILKLGKRKVIPVNALQEWIKNNSCGVR